MRKSVLLFLLFSMKKVYVIGSINQDIVIWVENFPRPWETCFWHELQYHPWGKWANQAIACKKVYPHVHFSWAIGNDDFGKNQIKMLEKNWIDIHILVDHRNPTGTALISVDAQWENMITVVPWANNSVSFTWLKKLEKLSVWDIIVLQNEIPHETNKKIIEWAAKHNITTIYNPAPSRVIDFSILSKISYLIVNETEFLDIFGIDFTNRDDRERHIKIICEERNISLILTLWKDGAIAYSDGQTILIEWQKVLATDTTGAGDCFVGSFAGCLAHGYSFKDSVSYANVAAALSVTKKWASSSYAERSDIDAIFDSLK